MRRISPLLLCSLLSLPLLAQSPRTFDSFFEERTMRVDYFHTGGPGEETFSLDRVVADGPWAGPRTKLLDMLDLGKYRFVVRDLATHGEIYSRGFSSIYGEWETTSDAKSRNQTFHESVRFPWPKKPVELILEKRGERNSFRPVWSTLIDPASRQVNRAMLEPLGEVHTIFESGPVHAKVDLLFLGEGYTAAEADEFVADARRLAEALFAVEPFRSRRSDFNVRAIAPPAARSGVHRVRANQNRRTPMSVEYNIFDSERYVLTLDNRALRDVASAAPYEFVEILVNERQYGGGGIYGLHSTAAAGSAFADYLVIHEFGHHFAALGDEYYTSPVAYETGAASHPEPWEPNITALHDPAALTWRDLVEPGTPIPTPWEKEEFEEHSRAVQKRRAELRAKNASEEELEALFREQQAWEEKFLASQKYAGKVGAFEGASYEPTGLYRPEADCIMFTRDRVGFCRVCDRAIRRVIDFHTD
ncbi:MAG TPA: M64 family metallopeptidase [Thermoanaerobaculia bacterium]|nr:M64 family metallopeptidase [Thermoanaerobaculia bacterium]